MYNREIIKELIDFVKSIDGTGDKEKVKALVQKRFSLIKDRSVFITIVLLLDLDIMARMIKSIYQIRF